MSLRVTLDIAKCFQISCIFLYVMVHVLEPACDGSDVGNDGRFLQVSCIRCWCFT